MSKKDFLKISDLKTDGLQIRAEINPDVVREYAEEETERGAVFPPFTVFRDSSGAFWLADGFHRLAAAKRNGRQKIAADVRDGEYLDALKFALLANTEHGLRRTNADKAKAVLTVYRHRSELGLPDVPSANSVAELAGVSNHFADAQLGTIQDWKGAKARTGQDGRTRTLPPPPTRKSKTVSSDDPQKPAPEPETKPSETSYIPPPPSRKSPQKKEETGPLDGRGKPVPPDLTETWNRRREVSELAGLVSRVRVALRDSQKGKDPLWSEINFSSVLAHLDMAYTEIAAAEPWCVCPMCQGIGCESCKGRGLMGKFRFESVVPKNMKGVGCESCIGRGVNGQFLFENVVPKNMQ